MVPGGVVGVVVAVVILGGVTVAVVVLGCVGVVVWGDRVVLLFRHVMVSHNEGYVRITDLQFLKKKVKQLLT